MAEWRAQTEHDAGPLARIDLTPVVGLLAVLLVLALMPLPPATHDVQEPLPASGILDGAGPSAIELTLDIQGRVTWDGITLLPDEFERRLGFLGRLDSPPRLYLRAPARMKFQHLVDVADAAQRHGVHVVAQGL